MVFSFTGPWRVSPIPMEYHLPLLKKAASSRPRRFPKISVGAQISISGRCDLSPLCRSGRWFHGARLFGCGASWRSFVIQVLACRDVSWWVLDAVRHWKLLHSIFPPFSQHFPTIFSIFHTFRVHWSWKTAVQQAPAKLVADGWLATWRSKRSKRFCGVEKPESEFCMGQTKKPCGIPSGER